MAQLRSTLRDWRVTLPTVGAAVVMIAVWSTFLRRPNVVLPEPSHARVVSPPNLNRDLQPTIANYQMIANQSLEKLDELLTRQRNRNLPPAPIYTASTFARANASD